MKTIQLELKNAINFTNKDSISVLKNKVLSAHKTLLEGTGAGNDFLGWIDLPSQTSDTLIAEIKEVAGSFYNRVEIIVVVGIGGSYLGAKAVIDALSHHFELLKKQNTKPIILYAGQNLSEDYLAELTEILSDRSFGICVISKSGTTTEPAIAFRVLKELLEQKVGKENASKHIVAITDKSKGALRFLADNKGYKSFVIPDNIGGRYSVFTPVGLLPIACAGIDISELLRGAKQMQKQLQTPIYEENIAMQYACVRNALYEQGKKIEILVNYNPKLANVAEWWKQLFGESEGKEGKGIFPASLTFSTDLHSMGQYIQEGERHLFETVLSIEKPNKTLKIPTEKENLDGLNYLEGRNLDSVNKSAEQGTILAHLEGEVPNLRIVLPKLNAFYLGQLLYFFEFSCALSGYVLGVNPFNQNGVEAYKKNMFALLGKS